MAVLLPNSLTRRVGMMPDQIDYCDEAMMAYQSSRKIFQPGEGILFDEGYRLAHLPLVNPGHPKIISEIAGRDYRNGSYQKTRYALVMPIAAETFTQSQPFRSLEQAMKSSAFAPKIAWQLGEARRSQLHATLASELLEGDLDRCAARAREVLDCIGAISFLLKGPFAGNRNTGRIYFPVYPQKVAGEDPFALLQKAIGAPQSRLYLVGFYHLRNELDARETAELAELLDQWRERIVVTATISCLELHATNDDLALSARTHTKIPVGR